LGKEVQPLLNFRFPNTFKEFLGGCHLREFVITIVGSGRVGSTIAQQVITRNLDDVTLIDIIQGLPQGEALDLSHMASDQGVDYRILGSNSYDDMKNSAIVVVTAGLARKPGMTRMDLLLKNAEIIRSIAKQVKEKPPNSILIMVTNPMDAMALTALKATGFPKNRVLGMGGNLDLSRFKWLVGEQTGFSRSSIQGLVIGEHGESMLPLTRFTTVSGIPLDSFLSGEQMKEIVEKTRKVAAEVIALKGATFYAPAHGVVRILESIIRDKRTIQPVSTFLEGEYGINGICIGVPVVISRKGVERIIEIELNETEMSELQKGISALVEAKKVLGY
jgi:malate dehydrogenase